MPGAPQPILSCRSTVSTIYSRTGFTPHFVVPQHSGKALDHPVVYIPLKKELTFADKSFYFWKDKTMTFRLVTHEERIMKKRTSVTAILLLVVLLLAASGQSPDQKADTSASKKNAPAEVIPVAEPSLIGEWTVIPADSTDNVGLVVREDGTYTRMAVDASVTGPYDLDTTQSPYALDLCVSECGGPGSEWTTLFCIFRFHTADTLELRYSPTGERYKEFAEKPGESTVFYLLKTTESQTEKSPTDESPAE